MARAMSASLASARMKSFAPCGSAWMRASLVSSDLGVMYGASSLPLPRGLDQGLPAKSGDADCPDPDRLEEEVSHRRLGNKQQGEVAEVQKRQDQLGREAHVADLPAAVKKGER